MKEDLVVHILEHIKSGSEAQIPPCKGHSEQEITEECCRLIDAGYLRGQSVRDHNGAYRGAGITGITREGIDYLEKRKGELKSSHPLHKVSKLAREATIFAIGAVAGGVLTKLGEYLFDLLKSHLP